MLWLVIVLQTVILVAILIIFGILSELNSQIRRKGTFLEDDAFKKKNPLMQTPKVYHVRVGNAKQAMKQTTNLKKVSTGRDAHGRFVKRK